MTSAFLDGARYWLGVVYLASVPGAVLFWFAIHPFAAFWRRAGAVPAYAAGFAVMIAAGVVAVVWRRPLMGADLGPNVVTAAIGLALIAISAVIRHRWRRQLTMRIPFGLPEIAPARFPPALLTDGIYATVRHPRYAEFSLGALGWGAPLQLRRDLRGGGADPGVHRRADPDRGAGAGGALQGRPTRSIGGAAPAVIARMRS